MTREEVLNLMAEMEGFVSGKVMATVRQIINICYNHRLDGREFTFDHDAAIDDAVNDLLVQLSDAIIDETERRIRLAIEDEDTDAVLAYVRRPIDGHDLQWRMDRHASNLKDIMEKYLDDKRKENRAELAGGFLVWMALNRQHFGKGVDSNPIKGMTALAQDTINIGNIKGDLLFYERDGAVGYCVYRGSNYDCEECDNVVYSPSGNRRLYSFEEDIPIPVHPNCVCYALPVYAEQMIYRL